MDKRIALSPGTLLPFPGMECVIKQEMGRGSNAIVYQADYTDHYQKDQRHTVLIKELFPFHPKGEIYREPTGAIACTSEAKESLALHRLSFQQGNRAHLQLLQQSPNDLGSNLNTFSQNGTLYTVLGFSHSQSWEQSLSDKTLSLKVLVSRMLSLLDSLESFHQNSFLHLDVAPDNILITGKAEGHRVMLIDYNSVYDMSDGEASKSFRYSTKQGYSAPEVRTRNRSAIGPATDLYSVAAVFYRSLAGGPLSPADALRSTAPDVSRSPLLKDAPATVVSMVQQILHTGLQTLSRRRYQDIGQMREAFWELSRRMEGVGITHWAIWEAGKRILERSLRQNPALSYLQDEKKRFPAKLQLKDGQRAQLSDLLSLPASPDAHFTLLATGGMGKTTAMLRAMLEHTAHYLPNRPTPIYLSLYGKKSTSTTYLQDRILENLRFDSDTPHFESARQSLRRLMQTPLQLSGKSYPSLILLLDGFNEAEGDTPSLLAEIRELSSLEGVRILVSGRNPIPTLPFETAYLCPLTQEESAQILLEHGLLVPESPAVCRLLCTPLMLSIFLETALAEEKQLSVETEDQLIEAYLSAIFDKALRRLSEADQELWQISCAQELVLPALAQALTKNSGALTDEQLLPWVTRCYKLLSASATQKLFPQWIGHIKAIKGSCESSEEWFGLMIHSILWQKLGLLVRNDRGEFQVVHQIICEHLALKGQELFSAIRKKQRLPRLMGLGITLGALGLGAYFLPPLLPSAPPPQHQDEIVLAPHNRLFADTLTEEGLSRYTALSSQYGKMKEALAQARLALDGTDTSYDAFSLAAQRYLERAVIPSMEKEELTLAMEELLSQGEVMPWSNMAFDRSSYEEFCDRHQVLDEQYQEYLRVLLGVMQDDTLRSRYAEEYLNALDELILLDANISAHLYALAVYPHLSEKYKAADAAAQSNYQSRLEACSDLNALLPRELSEDSIRWALSEELMGQRRSCETSIQESGVLYRVPKENT